MRAGAAGSHGQLRPGEMLMGRRKWGPARGGGDVQPPRSSLVRLKAGSGWAWRCELVWKRCVRVCGVLLECVDMGGCLVFR